MVRSKLTKIFRNRPVSHVARLFAEAGLSYRKIGEILGLSGDNLRNIVGGAVFRARNHDVDFCLADVFSREELNHIFSKEVDLEKVAYRKLKSERGMPDRRGRIVERQQSYKPRQKALVAPKPAKPDVKTVPQEIPEDVPFPAHLRDALAVEKTSTLLMHLNGVDVFAYVVEIVKPKPKLESHMITATRTTTVEFDYHTKSGFTGREALPEDWPWKPKLLKELGLFDCRCILGHDGNDNALYCAAPKADGVFHACAWHKKRLTYKPVRTRQSKDD